MRFVFLTLLLALSGCSAAGQQATPSPTPPDLTLDTGTIIAVPTSLKLISPSDPKFEAKEDLFRVRLPQLSATYKAATWPKSAGEMPTPGRASWDVEEAEIIVGIVPIPPGMIASWSREELDQQMTATIDSAIQSAKGKKVYEKDINIAGLHGKEAKVIAGGKTLFMRVLFANDRQYSLLAQLKSAENGEALVKAALDSFEIISLKEIG